VDKRNEAKPSAEQTSAKVEAAEVKELRGSELPLEVPNLLPGKAQSVRPKALVSTAEFPSFERIPLKKVPGLKLQAPQALRLLKLEEKYEFPEAVELRLSIPVLRLASPQRLVNLRLQDRIEFPTISKPSEEKAPTSADKPLVKGEVRVEEVQPLIREGIEPWTQAIQEEEEITPVAAVSAEEKITPGGGSQGEEVPDLMASIFKVDGGKIQDKGPKIILLRDLENDSHVGILEILCERIYREKRGGEPKAVKVSKIGEISKTIIEQELKAEHRIFTVDLDEVGINADYLGDRLREMYSQDVGFVIFVARSEGNFGIYEGLLEKTWWDSHGMNIRYVYSRKLLPNQQEQLASLTWGLVDMSGKSMTMPKFDILFDEASNEYKRRLGDIEKEERAIFKECTVRSKAQAKGKPIESPEHYDIKVFLVRYLTHEWRKRQKQLRTPKEIKDFIKTEASMGSGIVPDVSVESEVYEVETLFGEGEYPDLKITETVDKYDNEKVTKVNIVMDNLGFLMHLGELVNKQRHFEGKPFKVLFWTLDLPNKKLVSLSEMVRKLRKLSEEQHNFISDGCGQD
jgi:hypothetical protein